MDPRFEIPAQYKSQLRYREPLDARPDEAIVDELSRHIPVTSEKNIWTFWDTGLREMPKWCLRNIINWKRLCGPSWTIRLLDKVPGSPNNDFEWVEKDLLPDCFVDGTMEGPFVGPHSADLLRGVTLWKYGGIWMDVGVILFLDLDRLCWDQLADEHSPYEVSAPWVDGVVIGNFFVAAREGSVFMRKWHEAFTYLWKSRSSSQGLSKHSLLEFVFDRPRRQTPGREFKFPFKTSIEELRNYTAQITLWMRLALLEEPNGGFDGRKYWQEKVLKFDVLSECWAAEVKIGWIGEDLFDVLATKRTGPGAEPESEQYRKADDLVWHLLTSTSMQKVTHGKCLLSSPALGTLWDLPENEGKDFEPDTFAELLRYGSVHFEQRRTAIDYVTVEPDDFVIRKGLLEP